MLFDQLVASGLIKDNGTWTSLIGKVLDGGGMMVKVDDSEIAQAVIDGIDNVKGAVLGHVLAGLRYMVVGEKDIYPESEFPKNCEDQGGIYEKDIMGYFDPDDIQPYCLYLIQRPEDLSYTVPDEYTDKIEDHGVDVPTMLKNVANCRNGKQTSGDDTTAIYIGRGTYAPCYFGLLYILVDFGKTTYPDYSFLTGIQNKDDVPDWLFDNNNFDTWNPTR
ncbi:hypothetical protein O988_09707 [Pseudogymnoascus sp. VKM F-3808]|nr:hypothetical protein O988_09707 [Pseudogymnoascus sp. VKM F-3808]